MITHLPPQYDMENRLENSIWGMLVSVQWLFAFITTDHLSVVVSVVTMIGSAVKFLPNFLIYVRKAILQLWFLAHFFKKRQKRQAILKTWLEDFEKEKDPSDPIGDKEY